MGRSTSDVREFAVVLLDDVVRPIKRTSASCPTHPFGDAFTSDRQVCPTSTTCVSSPWQKSVEASCTTRNSRNWLIFEGSARQKKVLRDFHHGLLWHCPRIVFPLTERY